MVLMGRYNSVNWFFILIVVWLCVGYFEGILLIDFFVVFVLFCCWLSYDEVKVVVNELM